MDQREEWVRDRKKSEQTENVMERAGVNERKTAEKNWEWLNRMRDERWSERVQERGGGDGGGEGTESEWVSVMDGEMSRRRWRERITQKKGGWEKKMESRRIKREFGETREKEGKEKYTERVITWKGGWKFERLLWVVRYKERAIERVREREMEGRWRKDRIRECYDLNRRMKKIQDGGEGRKERLKWVIRMERRKRNEEEAKKRERGSGADRQRGKRSRALWGSWLH